MSELKTIIGIVAVVLTFIGYIPYIRDILKGKTEPHLYSWILWSVVTAIAFALQMSDNAGSGAWVTAAACLLCTTVFVLSLIKKSKKDIVWTDTLFFVLALISLALWLIAKQPVLSAILTTTTDLLGFVPTVRKSWNRPYTETTSFYYINSFRFALAVVALQRYTLLTALYPIAWLIANGAFALMLSLRRRRIPKPQS
jgi:hypothetical protein